MGRHNTVAGRMASAAAARGKLFTKLAREIMVAARNGSDISTNAALRTAVTKAKDNSMPKENIERAIKKGAGELGAVHYESLVYEGYAPGGVAVLVEVLTDNKNRTYPEIRRIFEKQKGTMAEIGAVSWMFQQVGTFVLNEKNISEEDAMEIALSHDGEDVQKEEEFIIVRCPAQSFGALRDAFAQKEIPFEKNGLEFHAQTKIELTEDVENAVFELIEKLEDHDDVQNVFHNIA